MPCRGIAVLLSLLTVGSLAAQRADPNSQRPVRITGVVVDARGEPIEGAAVHVVLPVREAPLPRPVEPVAEWIAHPDSTTDREGRFACEVPFASSLDITARDCVALRVGIEWRAVDPVENALELTPVVLLPGTTHVGTVRDQEGNPVPDAQVLANSALVGSWSLGNVRQVPWTAARTDARGRFRLPHACRSAVRIEVRADGHFPVLLSGVGEGTPLNIELRAGGHLGGRVVDAEGRPVVGQRVDIRYEASTAGSHQSMQTDADGRFRASRLAPGRWRAAGIDPETGTEFVGPIADGPREDVVLAPIGSEASAVAVETLELRVRAAGSNEPIEGARIGLRSSVGGKVPDYRTIGVPSNYGPWGKRACPTTDAEGRVRLPLPASGEMRRNSKIAVRAAGYEAWFADFDLEAEGPVLTVELQVEAVATGRVVDAEGDPIAGAEVFWLRRSSRRSSTGLSTPQPHAVRTDADGRYRLDGLPRSEVEILCAHPGYVSGPAVVLDSTETRALTADFTLHRGRSVALRLGEVRRPNGLVASLRIGSDSSALPDDQQGQVQANAYPVLRFDDDGMARALGMPHGKGVGQLQWIAALPSPYVLSCPAPPIPTGGDATVDVPAGSFLTGRLNGKLSTDGLPLQRFAVVAAAGGASSSGARIRVPVDAGGRFALQLLPGNYELSLVDLETGLAVFELDEPQEVIADRAVELQLAPVFAPVTLRLVPEAGPDAARALGDVELYRHLDGEARHRMVGTISARDQDSFDLLLIPGTYQLRMQNGAGALTAGGAWMVQRLEGPRFDVVGAGGQEVVFRVPPPTPNEEIDR